MNAKDVIRQSMQTAQMVTGAYLKDLSDADLLLRPVPGSNHIAWQLGHLIASERSMIAGVGGKMPELPAGFEDAHSPDASKSDDRSKFARKAQYEALMTQMHKATLAALDATPDADLDKPAPESMRSYAPTVGAVFQMIALHELMHVGQFVPVRRKLNKPIAI